MLVTQQSPAADLTTATRGMTTSPGSPGTNGIHPTPTGATPSDVLSVWSIAARRVRRIVERHTGGDAAAGDADAVAYEQVAVAAGDVVEVERLWSTRRRTRWSRASAVASPREQLGHPEGELVL